MRTFLAVVILVSAGYFLMGLVNGAAHPSSALEIQNFTAGN